ncbi:MAG: IS3 family transposase [Verrucomicrobia bacterium]|nr:IS3 family transposase [Verrucomicrobiota bacterium]
MIKELATDHSVSDACELLEVSSSGYYAWRSRGPSSRALKDHQIGERVKMIHEASRRIYGYPRVARSLRQEGIYCGKKRVARIMRQRGLKGSQKARYRPRTTDSDHDSPISPNRLRAIQTVTKPNDVWVSDITYIPTREGWRYLAAIMDLGTRNVKGWSLRDTLKTDLVADAFLQAAFRYRPDPGLIMHSDRGCQYASEQFNNLLDNYKALGSMSAKGNCYDNAAMESFWATLKSELNIKDPFETEEEARQVIFEYIEVFYNRQRLHSSIGYQSPVDYETQMMRKNATPSLSEKAG